ncbi:uncharacterized protein BJ171DRAFT_62987 [Polychytrium aggregatum]|uniref:uncharacterized protein n=1 Tax=Polychytrium aggregatum TaxID=110093 RepID=UPI0022FE2DEC|nr:uncharacterized protein BJ171DRAFT_62987 [Polychytrium aggregatum]KAI9205576.1 hypothetical protein BJ171DRAFT_62987 [Polychytrium aggregatum]
MIGASMNPPQNSPAPSSPSTEPTALAVASPSPQADLNPVPLSCSDRYTDRLAGWQVLLKKLIAHFELVSESQKRMAEAFSKSLQHVMEPVRSVQDVDVFAPDESFRSVFQTVFEAQLHIANLQLASASLIETETLPNLKALLNDVKKKLDSVQAEWGSLDKELLRDREALPRLLMLLSASLARHYWILGGSVGAPPQITLGHGKEAPRDPFIAKQDVLRHIRLCIHKQEHYRSGLAKQEQSFAIFEKTLVQHLRACLTKFQEASLNDLVTNRDLLNVGLASLNQISSDSDWSQFKTRNADVILDTGSNPLLKESDIPLPAEIEDAAVQVVHEGVLQRYESKILQKGQWRAGYYVLTASGFLHGFSNGGKEKELGDYEMGYYLPDSTILPSSPSDRESGEIAVQIKSGRVFGSDKYRFKALTVDQSDFWRELLSTRLNSTVPRRSSTSTTSSTASTTGPTEPANTSLSPSSSASLFLKRNSMLQGGHMSPQPGNSTPAFAGAPNTHSPASSPTQPPQRPLTTFSSSALNSVGEEEEEGFAAAPSVPHTQGFKPAQTGSFSGWGDELLPAPPVNSAAATMDALDPSRSDPQLPPASDAWSVPTTTARFSDLDLASHNAWS